jgi:hypothetical protein
MNTKNRTLKAVAAAALALSCGYAAASDSQTVTVQATVSTICKFSGTAAAIDFGTISPNAAAGTKSANITVPYKCTKGTTPAVTAGTITNMTNGAGGTMAFTVNTFTTVAATGFTAAVNATSTADIASAVWQDAPAGSYTGSVVVNIDN